MNLAESERAFTQSMRSKYPNLFPEPGNEDYAINSYGIETLPGWFTIVENMIDQVAVYAAQHALEDSLRITQIKSKFCMLRCTTTIQDKGIDQIIDQHAKQAFETCERCGMPGKLRTNRRWKMVLCDICEMKE